MIRTIPGPVGWPDAVRLTPHATQLSCGAELIVVPRAGSGLVEIRVVVPLDRSGRWATATQRLGITTRVTLDADQALADADWTVMAEPVNDCLVVSAHCLPDRLGAAVGILGELVRQSDPGSSEKLRAAVAGEVLRRQGDDVAQFEAAARWSGLGAHHPAADSLPADADPVELDGLLGPTGSTVVLVGDVVPEDVADRVDAAFEGWSGPEVTDPVPAHRGPTDGFVLVPRPGRVQAVVGLAGPVPGRDPAVTLATTIVGGPATSRLSVRLREQRGWAYWAQASLVHSRCGSYLIARAPVAAEVALAALEDIVAELTRLAEQTPTAIEVQTAARYAAGRVAIDLHTCRGTADALAADLAAGVDCDTRARAAAALREISPAEVQLAAERHLHPWHLQAIVVADPEVVREVPVRLLHP